MSDDVVARLEAVRGRIADAAARCGRRAEEVTLVGVSKRQPAAKIIAAVRAGLRHVGENYVQEAVPKLEEARATLEGLGLEPPCRHFIGHLQRNKAKAAVEAFDVIETLDRETLGDELERRAAAAGARLRALLQVNVSEEPQKAGVLPAEAAGVVAASARWAHLSLIGLMAIPAAAESPEDVRPAFARLRALRDELQHAPGGAGLTELSMGMSSDFEVAVEEGATIVRVGTALFGPRGD